MSDKAIYARVSTVDQDCAVQLAGLKELMQRYGWP
jgi:DNA invertase Pin-like site-specific DNA recombinase